MFGLHALDLVVIAAYGVFLIGIGLVAMFRVKTQEDFFLGGRRFGKLLQMFAAFGQATSSESAVGTVTTTYRDGAGGLWSHLILLWATPLYWLTAPWYRRMRVLTLGDFFCERYQSRLMGVFYSLVASFVMVISIGLGLKAISVTMQGIALKPPSAFTAPEQAEYARALRLETLSSQSAKGGLSAAEAEELASLRHQKPHREFSYLGESSLVWSIAILVFIYGTAGGLKGAVWADALQGTLILVLSVILIPFGIARLNAMHHVSGLTAAGRVLHQELPSRFFSLAGSALNADFTWYFIIVLSTMATLNVAVQSNILTANASARDERVARVGFMTGNFIKRFCIVLWGVVGLLAYGLYSRQIQNSDLVWGHATRDLLGGFGLGLVGLTITCLLAACQSSTSTMMISASSLFTRNVYEPLFPGRSESHYILVGRVAGAAVLAAAGLLCMVHDTFLAMLKLFWEYNAVVAAAFWCGLKWRRATRAGAWASMLTAFVLFVALPLGLPLAFPGLRTGERFLMRTQERTIIQVFPASPRDVEDRQREIDNWRGPESLPPRLREGEPVRRAFAIPPRAVCWAQGIREANGVKRGDGMFYPEMYLLGRVVDLTANPHALNETIRYGYKTLLPFLVLIAVSLLTRPDDSEPVRRFFLRMRTRVRPSRQEDEQAVQAAYAGPESTRTCLLFPRSQLEFFKWDKEDTIGFLAGCLVAAAVVGLLYLILHLGA